MVGPGYLASKRRKMPSSGWIPKTRRLGRASIIAADGKGWWGTGRNWIETSEILTGNRLPVRR